MSISPITAGVSPVACNHSNHLFNQPLCSDLPCWKKVAHVVFHIFTLGIPFLIYQIYIRSVTSPMDEVFKSIMAEVENCTPDSEIMDEWNQEKSDYSEINEKGVRFETLFCQVSKKLSESLYKISNPADRWNDQEVLSGADKLMKISYVASRFIAGELLDMYQRGVRDGNISSREERDVFFQVDGIFSKRPFLSVYHQLKKDIIEAQGEEGVKAFYREGTMQNSWRAMYNDYCSRVGGVLSERSQLWMKADDTPSASLGDCESDGDETEHCG